MSSSILIKVLMCSILQLDIICSRSPYHPCGSNNTPIAGPTCFLYYDCTFPGEKNLVACPVFSVFDQKTKSCASNYSAWITCLTNLNTKVNMNSILNVLNSYMMPKVSKTIHDILKTAENISKSQSSDSNPCPDNCQTTLNMSLCIIPYDNCTGYYNCSSPLSKFRNCKLDEKFDEFKRQCVTRNYASCGIGSSYPAEDKPNRKLRFCTESQMNECSSSESPLHDCIYSTKCLAYEDCSRTRANRYVNCSELRNFDSICKALFPEDCEKLPELLDEITNGVSISGTKYSFKEGEKAEFTCDSNLTSIEQFVWFIDKNQMNESERIKIVTERKRSIISISPILVQDSGLLNCSVEYGGSFHHTDSINIIVYPVPIVTISPSSQTLVKGMNGSSVQFTCNVTWSTFYLIKPFAIEWFVNGTHVSSKAFEEVSTQNLTFNESSSVTCCANMSQIGLAFSQPSFVTFLMSDDIRVVCKSETRDGLIWGDTKPGENFTHPCPSTSASAGKLVRSCFSGGIWGEINEDECLGLKINEISDLLDALNSMTADSKKSLKLAQLTQQLPNMSNTNNDAILKKMASILYRISSTRKTCLDENKEGKLETQNVLNSMVGIIQSKAWISNSSSRLSSLELIETLNVYSSHVWNDKTFTYSFNTNKLGFERSFLTVHDKDYLFNESSKMHKNKIKFFNKLQKPEKLDNGTIPVGASVMHNVANALTDEKNSSRINSDLISMDLVTSTPLSTQFTLQHLKGMPGFSPLCVFWFFNGSLDGYWSSDGCEIIERNENQTTCRCSHLTNFAILFSPSIADERNNMILGIISKVGCSISIIALFLTIILYIFKWRVLKSKRAVLLVNLCVSLIIANIIFLAGVDQTSNPAGCTAVSALLHYFFLSSFFMMLMLALHLFISVFFVFFTITKRHVIIMIVSGWLVPLIIVGISLAATKLRGYGSERNCWLSLEFGVLWAFVGPALAIIFTNMTIAVSVLVKICQMKISRINMKRSKWMSAAQNLVILNPILGLTWVFGVLSVDKKLIVFQYIFAIVNSLQGLFIFLLHGVCLKKSLSSQTRKFKDDKQLPDKSTPSSRTRIQVDDKSKMKSDEYYILNNQDFSQSSTYKPTSNVSSDSFSTDVTSFSTEKF